MKHRYGITLVALAAAFLAVQPAFAQKAAIEQIDSASQKRERSTGMHMVANGEVAADFLAGDRKERITGRISFHLVAPQDGVKIGQAAIRGFNVAFFGVPQDMLAEQVPGQEHLGLLGFATGRGKGQALRYDPEKGQLSGEVQLYADASFLNAYAEPAKDGKGDLFVTPVVPVTAAVRIDLGKGMAKGGFEPERVAAKLELRLKAKEMREQRFSVRAFELRLAEPLELHVDIGPIIWFEVAQRLCVQPVRLLKFDWLHRFGYPYYPVIQWSGAGLAFGEPGARSQWARADVVFTIRDWKTLLASSNWVLDASEADGLRALVDDDDCIEVFFVHDFAPQDMWGGGATWGSGTASAKIISSDGNARGGVDFTHLAHELGHVLGLRHPGAAATASAQPASSGTLLCPSGYLNDNPHVNSQENEDLLSNPLLTFALKSISAGPDCINNADCGACP